MDRRDVDDDAAAVRRVVMTTSTSLACLNRCTLSDSGVRLVALSGTTATRGQ